MATSIYEPYSNTNSETLVWVYLKYLLWSSKADTEVLECAQKASNELFVALKWIEVWRAFCADRGYDDGFTLLDILAETEEALDDGATVGGGNTHGLGGDSEKGTDFHFYSFLILKLKTIHLIKNTTSWVFSQHLLAKWLFFTGVGASSEENLQQNVNLRQQWKSSEIRDIFWL